YSFIDYIGMNPGTSHQAQCWQLKAGVNSALDDIKSNHPNDLVGMAFFTDIYPNTGYLAPIVLTGQDWSTLKNSLFFPRTLLGSLSNMTSEIRPYDSTIVSNGSGAYTGFGDVPNAQYSTDPNTGLAAAFNLLAPSQYISPSDPTRRGRKGAAKIVILETDGIPNSAQQITFNANGYDSYYTINGRPNSTHANNNTTAHHN